MFTGYNVQFPYSYITDRLVKAFPAWTKIRKDPQSIGAQFLNVFGLEMNEVDNFLEEALNNQYIGSANIGEISIIYKAVVDTTDIDSAQSIVGYDTSSTPAVYLMKECQTLFEFYSAAPEDEAFIIDFEAGILYMRNPYSKIEVTVGASTTAYDGILPHHVWNIFDEFALLLGIKRRYLESNASLKERILDVFRFPGNATRLGLARAIGRELGLVYNTTWPEGQNSFMLDETVLAMKIVPETIILNGVRLKADQYDVTGTDSKAYTIYPRATVFFDRDLQYRYDNVRLTSDKKVLLNSGIKEGFIITPVIEPSNLKTWDKLVLDATGNVTVDIVRYDFESYADQSKAYLVQGLTNGDDILIPGATPLTITQPVRLIINMKRNLRSDPSPQLNGISLTYIPAMTNVAFVHDVGLEALHDDKFRNSLFDERGTPCDKLKNYVNELTELVPIMWGRFKWDESYWDVVDKNLMGLHVLPNKWDPRLGEISNIYFQTGMGFGLDCLVKFDDDSWYPKIHNGYFYISANEQKVADGTDTITTDYPDPQFVDVRDSGGKNYTVFEAKKNILRIKPTPATGTILNVTFSTENFIYASPQVYNFTGPVSKVTLPPGVYPMQGAPIIVNAKFGGKGVSIKQVAFFDGTTMTITNTEKIAGNGTDKIAISYNNPINIDVTGYTVTGVDENVLTLSGVISETEEVSVSYSVKDSFIINYDAVDSELILSDTYTDIEVAIESRDDTSYLVADTPCFDPLTSHITQGFLYITNTVLPLQALEVKVDPDVISGDGYDPSLIVVDSLDQWGNPVLNQTPAYTLQCIRDDTSGSLVDSGTLTLKDTYYNRHIYQYVSPPYDIIPKRTDGTGRNVACTTTITFSCSGIQATAKVKVR